MGVKQPVIKTKQGEIIFSPNIFNKYTNNLFYSSNFLKMIDELCPPNPKLLLKAALTVRF